MKIEQIDNEIFVIDELLTQSEEESINVQLKDTIAVVTIGPLDFGGGSSRSDDNGDGYGCCSGESDGYI